MSRIYGVLCDGCQKVDAVSADDLMYEDLVPRNGWTTITVWGMQSEIRKAPMPEKDIHVCSLDCMIKVANSLKDRYPNSDQQQNVE